jgi:hypothetical protein
MFPEVTFNYSFHSLIVSDYQLLKRTAALSLLILELTAEEQVDNILLPLPHGLVK